MESRYEGRNIGGAHGVPSLYRHTPLENIEVVHERVQKIVRQEVKLEKQNRRRKARALVLTDAKTCWVAHWRVIGIVHGTGTEETLPDRIPLRARIHA